MFRFPFHRKYSWTFLGTTLISSLTCFSTLRSIAQDQDHDLDRNQGRQSQVESHIQPVFYNIDS